MFDIKEFERIEWGLFWLFFVSLILSMVLSFPGAVKAALIGLVPYFLLMIGASQNFPIEKKWYFWLVTVICVSYLIAFMLTSMRKPKTNS